MIQCAGKLSEKPYYIKETDTNVYSLEEINYFVYNHMNLVYRDFFGEPLFDYIEESLQEKALAGKLRAMEKAGADLKDLITCLFKESGYYDGNDLLKISGFVMNMDNISEMQRLKAEADKLFRDERYEEAKALYIKIVNERENPVSDEQRADAAFSAGLCCADLFLCRSANTFFNMAYDIFPKDDYAKAGVYLSIALEDEEELLKAIIRYRVSDEALERIRANVRLLRKNIAASESLFEFVLNIQDNEAALSVARTFKEEYYRMTK